MNTSVARQVDNKVLLTVEDLVTRFPVRAGLLQRIAGWVHAVDGVSFTIRVGETLGLVGESGCGKTTVGRSILRLVEPTSGSILVDGRDILKMHGRELKAVRRQMQIVFQDPFASLDPRKRIGASIAEGLNIHHVGSAGERKAAVSDLLHTVGLEDYHANRYPHEFSGGQRQRIGIARALALRPRFVIADEPVSALDVSIQADVLNLLKDLQEEFSLTYLFVAHNMSVVEHISTRVAVMYLGLIVELATREQLFAEPLHPYTVALMSAIPIPDPGTRRKRIILQGDVPSPITPPTGCRFHPRCPSAIAGVCSERQPILREVKPGHWVACWLHG